MEQTGLHFHCAWSSATSPFYVAHYHFDLVRESLFRSVSCLQRRLVGVPPPFAVPSYHEFPECHPPQTVPSAVDRLNGFANLPCRNVHLVEHRPQVDLCSHLLTMSERPSSSPLKDVKSMLVGRFSPSEELKRISTHLRSKLIFQFQNAASTPINDYKTCIYALLSEQWRQYDSLINNLFDHKMTLIKDTLKNNGSNEISVRSRTMKTCEF